MLTASREPFFAKARSTSAKSGLRTGSPTWARFPTNGLAAQKLERSEDAAGAHKKITLWAFLAVDAFVTVPPDHLHLRQ